MKAFKPPSKGTNISNLEDGMIELRNRLRQFEDTVDGNNELRNSFAELSERLEQLGRQLDDTDMENDNEIERLAKSMRNAYEKIEALETAVENISDASEKKLLLEGLVQDIYNQRFEEAIEKLDQLDPNEIPQVIKTVYDYQIGNFDVLHRFGKCIQDVVPCFAVFKALQFEMNANGHNDPSKLILLIESLVDGVESRSDEEGITSELTEIVESLEERIDTASLEAIKDSWTSGRLDKIKGLSDEVFSFNEDMWKSIFRRAIHSLSKRLDLSRLIEDVREESDASKRAFLYKCVLEGMAENDQLNNTDVIFKLARRMKSTAEESSDAEEIIESAKEKLPTSVANVVFSRVVYIQNVLHRNYLFAVMNYSYFVDKDRRSVFQWKPGNPVSNGTWTFEFDKDDVVFIKSVEFQEYLYAPSDYFKISGRRPVFTWVPRSKDDDAKWRVEVDGDYLRFRNIDKNSEYLYGSKDEYNHERQYVYTGFELSMDSPNGYGDPRLWCVSHVA